MENRKKAFMPKGTWTSWFLTHDAVAKVQDTVFVHGGVTEEYAKLGIPKINEEIKLALQNGSKSPILSSDGPLWFRGYLKDDEEKACGELQRALRLLKAKRMVVGHTTQRDGIIKTRCSGSLIAIDTGISAHYGKNLAVLDLSNDNAIAIYKGKTIDLPDPE
jgi:hypothetical protein